jgi:transposase
LTGRERGTVQRLVAAGTAPARTLTHARILLKADRDGPGWPDARIAEALDVGLSTIARVRRAFVHGGVDAALQRRPPSVTRPPKLDGRQEAHLVALSCTTPPDGRARWSLRLLTDRFVELEGTLVSDETVRRVLKKTHSSRG